MDHLYTTVRSGPRRHTKHILHRIILKSKIHQSRVHEENPLKNSIHKSNIDKNIPTKNNINKSRIRKSNHLKSNRLGSNPHKSNPHKSDPLKSKNNRLESSFIRKMTASKEISSSKMLCRRHVDMGTVNVVLFCEKRSLETVTEAWSVTAV